MSEMADVVLDQVTKVFPGGTVAVDSVSLHVADGEFMVLVGPSGCGKSTVLRMIAGLEDVTEGTVSIGGRMVNHLPPKERDIAMVFQNYALYPHMTVEENLAFSLRIRRMPKAELRSQVTEAAHVLDLEPLLGRKPVALSGGQRQRVAMGRAIVRRPRVFLMDEPLSNLDAKLRVAMRGELSRLHQRYSTTTVYVTHDQVEAMTLGDRIAVLERGRLQQVGPPDELYASPRNIFVAGFIGSPAMNLARARIEAAAEGLILVVGEHRWPLPGRELARRPSLAGYAGREVVFGLRPGSVSLAAGAAPDAPRLSVEATTVESLGSEKNLLFVPPFGDAAKLAPAPQAAGEETGDLWTARVGAFAPVRTADRVELAVDLTGLHFFDPDTTEAIAVVTDATLAAAGNVI
jgi:multiple sugar transport system ATP-binding protein